MKTGKTRRRLPPEERRTQLLRAAVKMAAVKGLGRVVHADVAAESGVSISTAFLYFPDREAMLKAIIAEVDRYYRAIAREQHGPHLPPLQRIRNHAEIFADSIDADPDYAMVWLEWSTMFRNEYGLWDAFLDFQEFIISAVARSIRKSQLEGTVSSGIVPQDSARLMVAGSYTLTQLKLMKRSPAIVKRYVDQLLQMTLQPR